MTERLRKHLARVRRSGQKTDRSVTSIERGASRAGDVLRVGQRALRLFRRGGIVIAACAVTLCGGLQVKAEENAARATVTLAIWGAPEQRNTTALLVAELSGKSEHYRVLEREQLDRVVSEQVLQSSLLSLEQAVRAGRLLGADGVLWVEGATLEGQSVVITRLCTTGSGVVIGWQVDNSPLPDPAGWAKLMATRLESWARKLKVPRESAVPLSVLDLRGATGAVGSVATGQTLKTLLGARLSAQPELFVLERWRLDELAWERVLGGDSRRGFWSGAWLLDGSVTDVAGEVEVSLRLRGSDGRELRWTRRGRGLDGLVANMAADILQRLSLKSPVAPWDPKAEAEEFFAEAEWAARWRLDARALESAEAAIALGLDSTEARRLRYLACSRMAVNAPRHPLVDTGMVNGFSRQSHNYRMPEPWRIEQALRSILLFNDLRRSASGREAMGFSQARPIFSDGESRRVALAEQDACALLNNAARILWTAYYAKRSDTPEADAAIATLRREAGALFEREMSVLSLKPDHRPADRMPVGDRGGRGYPVQLGVLPYVGFVHGALWKESAADHEAFVYGVLSGKLGGGAQTYNDLITMFSSTAWERWGVDWKTRDPRRAHARWERFARGLLGEEDLGLQVAGALWLLSLRDWNYPGDEEAYDPLIKAAWGNLIRNLDRLADSRLPVDYYREALAKTDLRLPLSTRDELVSRVVEQLAKTGPVPGGVAQLIVMLPLSPPEKARLRAPLQAKVNAVSFAPPWSAEERDAVLKCFQRLEVVLPASHDATDSFPAPVAPRVRQGTAHARAPWLVPDPDAARRHVSADRPSRGIRWASLEGDRLWLITCWLENYQTAPLYRLGVIDLPGLSAREVSSWRAQTFKDMEWDHLFPAFAKVGDWIYSWEERGLCRRPVTGGNTEVIVLPITKRPRLWSIRGWLYLGLADGGVLRVNSQTNAWELLADSHRRPAQGPLDDCPRYEVARIWQDADRGLCLMKSDGRGLIYSFDEGRRGWAVHEELKNVSFSDASDRRLVVEVLQESAMAAPGHGWHLGMRLFSEAARIGTSSVQMDAGTFFGGEPPVVKPGARLERWSLIGVTAEGRDLWGFFDHGMEPRRMAHLVWLPEPPAEPVAIEFQLPDSVMKEVMRDVRLARDPRGGVFGERARIITGPHGLFIYAVGSPVMWFVERRELDAAGATRGAEPTTRSE